MLLKLKPLPGPLLILFRYFRKRSGEEHETIMEDDLRICTVKPVPDGERRFCFEVLSPTK